MSDGDERALHKQGFVLIVEDDGVRHIYEDVIDFGPMWTEVDDAPTREITGFRVKTEEREWIVFEPAPEQLTLVNTEGDGGTMDE